MLVDLLYLERRSGFLSNGSATLYVLLADDGVGLFPIEHTSSDYEQDCVLDLRYFDSRDDSDA